MNTSSTKAKSYTAGPWRSLTFLAGSNDQNLIDEHYHQIEAGCGYDSEGPDAGFTVSGCLSEADANLIAAAPELLEALRDCLPHITASGEKYCRPKAIAAIAKALGGSHAE